MIYKTGSVRVRVGSALVKGESGNEAFSSNVSAGNLFKLTGEATFYTIAAITNATNFSLSARYANSTYQTARAAEHLATMTVATKMYSGTLNYYPVIQSAITITASGETFTDDSGGILAGDASPPGSGTVNYDTGAWSVILGTALTASCAITASYQSGDTRTGQAYQIVTDYTPIYTIPEMSLNDVNFPHIYTKAVRIIDNRLSIIASILVSLNATAVTNLQASVHELYGIDTNHNASLSALFVNDTNHNASLSALFVLSGTDYSASIHELYGVDTNHNASLSALFVNDTNHNASLSALFVNDTSHNASLSALFVSVGNLEASTGSTIRTIINHAATTTVVKIPNANLNKLHRFMNTATCVVTIATITAAQKGYWLMCRKKGIGFLDFKRGGANTIDTDATHIYNDNASITNSLLKLSIETATNFEIEDMRGDWVTY